MQQIENIKLVKNSVVLKDDNGSVICLHYNTEIFKADKDRVLINLYCPSVTSSKMAKRVYEFVFGSIPDLKEWKQLKEKYETIRSINQ